MFAASWASLRFAVFASMATVAIVCNAQNSSTKSQMDVVRDAISEVVAIYRKPVLRAVIEADISSKCQLFLAKFASGFERIEPWTNRLIDASGRMPVGLFQGTLSDLGAYDACIETVLRADEGDEETLRGQYCNVLVKSTKGDYLKSLKDILALSHRRTPDFVNFQNSADVPGVRIGICLATDCDHSDIQKLANKAGDWLTTEITVSSCSTSLPTALETRQILVLILCAVLLALVLVGTLTDYLSESSCANKKSDSVLSRILRCFSFRANSALLMRVNDGAQSEQRMYRFIHGMKFWSMYGVVFGHAYSVFDFTVISRLANALHYGDSIWFCLVMAAYLCVDTFLFVGGFLLTYNIVNAKENQTVVTIVAIARRFIRGTLPALFVMVLIFLVPVFFNGPKIQDYYNGYKTQFSLDWWTVVLQIRNLKSNVGLTDHDASCMGPLWYLSVDFQLFVVVLVCLMLTNRDSRKFHIIMCVLSVASMIFTGIYIHNTIYTPFVLPMAEDWQVIKQTLLKFYYLTTTHSSCYFLGASTMILVRDYKNVRLSKMFEALCWAASFACAVISILSTFPWNSGHYPGEGWKVLVAMTQRPLWAVSLSWLTFACATGRGGPIAHFLSWNGFVPLSRLSFGVYLIHLPLYFLEAAMTRERIFFSNINMTTRSFSMTVWSFLFAFCHFILVEAPLGRLEKMILRQNARPTQTEIDSVNNKKNFEASHPEAYRNNGFYQSSQQELSSVQHLSIKL